MKARCSFEGDNEVAQLPENSAVIKFYRVDEPFGEFSNFAPFPITIDGQTWPTTEHFFQAQKFNDESYREEIRKAKSPMDAARLGRDHCRKMRSNWKAVRVDVMRKALEAKFTKHSQLRELLTATGDALLIEHTSNDSFWGDGGDGLGKNLLGRLLMELRARLLAEL